MIMNKTQACIQWIKEYFKDNPDGKAIIGISGGKDSTIAAALCVEALGADRVIGLLMHNYRQADINDSLEVVSILDIEHLIINIGMAYTSLITNIEVEYGLERENIPSIITTNTPARLRMATLYMVAGMYPNSRVVNTCNASEDYVGYSTKYGDAAGDFSPLGNLTVREVLEIGDELGIPEHLVHKAPSDGMCGKTDEDNLGFTYDELDNYILGTGKVSDETKAKIERLHKSSRHKYQPIPTFHPLWFDIDSDQLSVDDYANGGQVDPSVTASAMAGNAIMTGFDIVEPAAANNVSINTDYKLEDAIKSIENSLWRSVMCNEIRGIK